MKKLLALDTLNEDRERIHTTYKKLISQWYDKPLVLTDEVKEEQSEMPF